MHRYTTCPYLLILFVSSMRSASGQESPQPVLVGERVTIASQILNEDRQLVVHTPRSYERGDERYGVLYLLDGNPNFLHTSAITEFVARDGLAPGLIVVAIVNSDRNRDLTPPSQSQVEVEAFPTHGGAEVFREFIRSELMPWTEQNFRANDLKLLVGHSFGGLFAIDTLISEPEIFDAYISVSPSLQWNDQALVTEGKRFFETQDTLSAAVFLSVGDERGALLGGVRQFVGILDSFAPSGLRWDYRRIPTETHNTVALPGIYQGLRSIFQGWQITNAAGLAAFNESGIDGVHELFRKRDEAFGAGSGGKAPYTRIVNLTNYLIGSGRLQEAEDVTLHDLSAFPPAEELTRRLVGAYIANGDEDTAIVYLRRLREQDSSSGVAERLMIDLGLEP